MAPKDITKSEIPRNRKGIKGKALAPGGGMPKPPPMAMMNDQNPAMFKKPPNAFEDTLNTDIFKRDPEMNAMSKERGKKLGTNVPMYTQNEHEAHRANVRKSIKGSIREIKQRNKI